MPAPVSRSSGWSATTSTGSALVSPSTVPTTRRVWATGERGSSTGSRPAVRAGGRRVAGTPGAPGGLAGGRKTLDVGERHVDRRRHGSDVALSLGQHVSALKGADEPEIGRASWRERGKIS